MKVAVLDLGTVFAQLFKPFSSAAASSPPYSPAATSAPPPKSLLPLPASPCPLGTASSLPARSSAALAPSGSSALLGTSRGVAPGGSGAGTAAKLPGGGGANPSGNSSPRFAAPSLPREPAAWAAPAGKQLLFFTLPDIGEEGTPDTDPQEEEASAPRKGLSKGSADRCFQGKSENSLPAPFTRSVQEAIDNYTFVSVSSLSSSGQTTPTDLNHSWSGIQSCTTGPSTERSSVYSWRDDEFDKANTQRVHQLFWDVDEMLFEGKVGSQTENLKAECKDWTNRSLHLRILGKQLLFPKDEGFQHYQSRNVNSVYSRSLPSLSQITGNMKELCVSGSRLIPEASPVHKSFSSNLPGMPLAESSVYSFLEEEIYDVEGKIEEYLAFDNKDLDDESLEQKKSPFAQKRTKYGIPPVSPNACIKDTVAAEVFDHVWKNVIGVLEELIRKYWESSIAENDKRMEKMKTIGNKLHHLSVSRVIMDTSSVPPSRGSEARGTSFGLHLVPSQIHRFPSNLYSDLNGVMTIQAKPLQQRHSGLAEKTQNEQEDKPQGVASSVNSVRNRLGRITDSSVLSSSRVLQGSSRKMPGHRRLPSIAADPQRSKTPNVYSDEVLRGTKLCTALDSLSSPLPPTSRNKLPPISSEAVDQYLSVPASRPGLHRGRYPHNRISSAVPGGTERRPLKERTVLIDQFSRPSTTHTFRSDTPHKRSLTSMDFANHMWTGQGVLTGSQFHAKSFQRNPPVSRRRFQVAL
ncbi:protein FAM149A isoform X2 [Hemicordylus capensis]|uniref:protein FAM149A isoform X2 n=1 Tax=Hemicordylus capensis TaxID=884348 RepID=UPI0023020A32|nr:protein FAM149A isoform X2 [Hemicordylus capensis]